MNENAGTIDLSATFDNRDFFSSSVSDMEYTVSVKPSLPIYSPTPAYNDNGYYIVYDINSKIEKKYLSKQMLNTPLQVKTMERPWGYIIPQQTPSRVIQRIGPLLGLIKATIFWPI